MWAKANSEKVQPSDRNKIKMNIYLLIFINVWLNANRTHFMISFNTDPESHENRSASIDAVRGRTEIYGNSNNASISQLRASSESNRFNWQPHHSSIEWCCPKCGCIYTPSEAKSMIQISFIATNAYNNNPVNPPNIIRNVPHTCGNMCCRDRILCKCEWKSIAISLSIGCTLDSLDDNAVNLGLWCQENG